MTGARFEMRAGSGTITTLASFNGTNGALPSAGLVEDGSGNLFGTTFEGGASGDGTVFEVRAGSGTITTLTSFNGTNGALPYASLVDDSSGNLFGAASGGGPSGDGTVFELPVLIQTVNRASTSTTLVSSVNPSVSGQSVTFTGTVTINSPGSNAAGNPTGVVTFYDGGVSIGQGTLDGVAPDTATFAISTLSTGTHAITAAYTSGNVNASPSPTSTAITQTVDKASTTTSVTSSADPSVCGQTVTFTAAVSVNSPGSSAAANPTGTVTFYDNGVSIGTGALTRKSPDTATFTTSTLSVGTHPITANYGGDTNFAGSTGSGALATLASFNITNGESPEGDLVEDGSGNLFGTTFYGGASNGGTVFEVRAGSSTITTLASFNGTNGAKPGAGLVEDGSGNLFGTTSVGGASGDGTVFEVKADSGTITTLAPFNGTNGEFPYASLVEDSSGNLFGTTTDGGASGDGTVFEVRAGSSAVIVLASFNNTNGANPVAGLLEDASGNLFGTTAGGDASGDGTVFEVKAGSGTITTLASFDKTNGAAPFAGLVEDGSGNLFGTTTAGGASGDGTVFEVKAGSGTITTLASFNGVNGADPHAGLVEDGSGNFFGTTSGGGAASDGTGFEVPRRQRHHHHPGFFQWHQRSRPPRRPG